MTDKGAHVKNIAKQYAGERALHTSNSFDNFPVLLNVNLSL